MAPFEVQRPMSITDPIRPTSDQKRVLKPDFLGWSDLNKKIATLKTISLPKVFLWVTSSGLATRYWPFIMKLGLW